MADTQQSGGIGFWGLLAILFIGLKLTHYIDWSWVWVLAPIWIPITVAVGILIVVCVVWLGLLLVARRTKY